MSDQINDGGPAFPAMSLRDYFAGQAMLGMLHETTNAEGFKQGVWREERATLAYAQADAMLAARKEAPRE